MIDVDRPLRCAAVLTSPANRVAAALADAALWRAALPPRSQLVADPTTPDGFLLRIGLGPGRLGPTGRFSACAVVAATGAGSLTTLDFRIQGPRWAVAGARRALLRYGARVLDAAGAAAAASAGGAAAGAPAVAQ